MRSPRTLLFLLVPALAACPLTYEGACAVDDNCPTGQSCFEGRCRVSTTPSMPPDGGGDDGGMMPSNVEGPGGTCFDGIDNDSDGQKDCGDPDCANQVCRAAKGACDLEERCTDGACPATDEKAGAGVVCRPAVDGGCDTDDMCDGTSDECGTDVVAAMGTTCRAAAGDCDAPEVCDGTLPTCPDDRRVDAGVVCRPIAGDCDVAEVCDGVATSCGADARRQTTEVCRPSAGDCDPAEHCTGDVVCPMDVRSDSTVVCRAASDAGCDVEERCNGGTSCPADGFAGLGTPCRMAAGTCDVEERCSGTSPVCPVDAFRDAGTVCRPDAGACDLAEVCSGSSAACPANVFASGGVCRPSAGACDMPESCMGGADCPADVSSCAGQQWCSPTGCQAKKTQGQTCSSGVECANGNCFDGRCCDRACGGDCESCNASGVCTFDPPTTVCRPDAGVCDVRETCSGNDGTCPPDLRVTANTTCRPSLGACDPAEVCNGTAVDCPGDVRHGPSTVCRPVAGGATCDVQEVCDGTNAACPMDRVQAMGTECRTSGGSCDPAELCDGTSPMCPGNAFAPANTPCGLAFCANGMLTPAPRCVGSSNTCQMFSQTSCGGFQCNSTGDGCLSTCTANTDCLSSHYCQGSSCVPKIADGQPCMNPGDCISGVCLTGYQDLDADNYGAGAQARFCTMLPTTPIRYVANAGDCCDSNVNVRPNQTQYFSTPIPGACSSLGFNYDCSTFIGNPSIQHEYPANACTGYSCGASPSNCLNTDFLNCGGTSRGWSGAYPGCGVTGTLRTCGTFDITCGTGERVCSCGTTTTSAVVDRCR